MPLHSTDPATRIPFNGSPNPTIGVELELQIMDPETMNLTSGSVAIFDKIGEDHAKIKAELTQSTVEIITGVCKNVAEIRADLSDTMRELYEVGDELGLVYAAAGTHPFAQWREQSIYPNERYSQLVERIQWPARRLMIYGMHVHVGVSSGEKAIAISNGLKAWLAPLLALSASSPFVDFEDTGLASARSKIFEGMPTAGIPYQLNNYGEFQQFMNSLIRAGAIQSIREIWWDIRPHPSYGTLEVRICDIPSTMTEVAAIAALIQCMVVMLDDMYENGMPMNILHPWMVRENKWRAARYGIDASIIVDNTGSQSTIRHELEQLIQTLEPYAYKLDCVEELQGVRQILRYGGSYQRQRNLYKQTNDFKTVQRSLVESLRNDVGEAVKTSSV